MTGMVDWVEKRIWSYLREKRSSRSKEKGLQDCEIFCEMKTAFLTKKQEADLKVVELKMLRFQWNNQR